jgi:hypothetical protein
MGLITKTAHFDVVDGGSHTTVTAADTVQTDLREVLYVTADLASSPILAADRVSISIPNQVTNPGQIIISTWKPTSTTDTTPIAATTFARLVQWIAFGR